MRYQFGLTACSPISSTLLTKFSVISSPTWLLRAVSDRGLVHQIARQVNPRHTLQIKYPWTFAVASLLCAVAVSRGGPESFYRYDVKFNSAPVHNCCHGTFTVGGKAEEISHVIYWPSPSFTSSIVRFLSNICRYRRRIWKCSSEWSTLSMHTSVENVFTMLQNLNRVVS